MPRKPHDDRAPVAAGSQPRNRGLGATAQVEGGAAGAAARVERGPLVAARADVAAGAAGRPERPERLLSAEPRPGEKEWEASLRPRRFDEFIGQRKVKDNLAVFVAAARIRDEALDHVLLCGPPGLGKTTLAYIIANELGVGVRTTSGPAIDHRGTMASLLTALSARDVLFVDEIHRLNAAVEEYLYPAMEDYRIDVVTGEGPYAQSINLELPRFTLVGATTRTGLLSSPLRGRFGIVLRLDYYDADELAAIVARSAHLFGVRVDDAGRREVASRARGTPRIANRLLRRVWDFALVEGDGRIDRQVADHALGRLEVDGAGLDPMDRALLRSIIEKFDGGPVGIESLAAALSEERDTLEDVYEPYLIQEGFLQRTPRGRVATRRAHEHLGLVMRGQGRLL